MVLPERIFVAIDDVGHGVTSRWHLHVECAFLDCERCLTHCLGHRRVRVADAGDVLGRGLELHGHDSLGDQVGCAGADDVHAQAL